LNAEIPLTVEEIKAELSLCIERLNINANGNKQGDALEEHGFLTRNLKKNVEGQIRHKAFQYKN
jgi:hypothetical protein